MLTVNIGKLQLNSFEKFGMGSGISGVSDTVDIRLDNSATACMLNIIIKRDTTENFKMVRSFTEFVC